MCGFSLENIADFERGRFSLHEMHFCRAVLFFLCARHKMTDHCWLCVEMAKKEETQKNQYQKLLEIEKEIVHEVVRGDKHNLRKSAHRKAQIGVIHSALSTDLCFAIC